MSGYVDDPSTCESMQEELTELALATLSGRSRSEVLEHVKSCPRCSTTLEQLADVTDTLLLLSPEVEPPLGFESRLAGKLEEPRGEPERVTRLRRLRRTSLLLAVAAVLALLGFGLTSLVGSGGGNNPVQSASTGQATANLTSDGHVVGQARISGGQPAWMYMTVNGVHWSGTVKCQATLAGGKVETVGVFNLSNGSGDWGAPLTSPAGDVRSARLVSPNGTVLASARFSA